MTEPNAGEPTQTNDTQESTPGSDRESVSDLEPDRGVPEISGVTLLEDEEVLHDVRPSWAMFSGALAWGVVTVWFGLGLLFFAYAWLARKNSRYIVTNQRLIEKTGLFSSSTSEYRIRDIRQLQTGATFSEKLASCGHIEFSTGSGSSITFNGINNYTGIANTIREQQRKLE